MLKFDLQQTNEKASISSIFPWRLSIYPKSSLSCMIQPDTACIFPWCLSIYPRHSILSSHMVCLYILGLALALSSHGVCLYILCLVLDLSSHGVCIYILCLALALSSHDISYSQWRMTISFPLEPFVSSNCIVYNRTM